MDFDRLLAPIDGDSPSGVELRHDMRFHDLERLTERAAREYRLNDDGSLADASPNVDWQAIVTGGEALAAEGRDLRLLCLIVRAEYNVEGFAALAKGLDFLAQTVTQYWDTLHPALRDRDDPKVAALPRLNALRQLENDDNGLLGDMRFGVVLNPRGIGPVTGDDLAAASLSDFEMLSRAASGLSQAEKAALSAAHAQRVNRVNAATRGMAADDAEQTAALIAAITGCETALTRLNDAVAEAGGIEKSGAVPMSEMQELLALSRKTLEGAVAATNAGNAVPEDNPAVSTPVDPATPSDINAPAVTAKEHEPANGAINSRRDVESSLDRIIAFYERTEPSSPIPHLARRMRRMVAMDFLELMEEIAPSGLKEFRTVAGVDEPKKK